VNNFFQGNVLTFGTDLSGSISNTNSFKFDNAFTSSWSQGTSTFTITAIPEPSTQIATVGLLSLLLWPLRRRLTVCTVTFLNSARRLPLVQIFPRLPVDNTQNPL
jgi:hypothetical protein